MNFCYSAECLRVSLYKKLEDSTIVEQTRTLGTSQPGKWFNNGTTSGLQGEYGFALSREDYNG